LHSEPCAGNSIQPEYGRTETGCGRGEESMSTFAERKILPMKSQIARRPTGSSERRLLIPIGRGKRGSLYVCFTTNVIENRELLSRSVILEDRFFRSTQWNRNLNMR
jgi:hypothetical protein